MRGCKSPSGLRVGAIDYVDTSLGTVVLIEETATAPERFIERWGRANPNLMLDAGDVEGSLLVINDDAGRLVKYQWWVTGTQSGESGYGPDYADLDRSRTMPTVAAP